MWRFQEQYEMYIEWERSLKNRFLIHDWRSTLSIQKSSLFRIGWNLVVNFDFCNHLEWKFIETKFLKKKLHFKLQVQNDIKSMNPNEEWYNATTKWSRYIKVNICLGTWQIFVWHFFTKVSYFEGAFVPLWGRGINFLRSPGHFTFSKDFKMLNVLSLHFCDVNFFW